MKHNVLCSSNLKISTATGLSWSHKITSHAATSNLLNTSVLLISTIEQKNCLTLASYVFTLQSHSLQVPIKLLLVCTEITTLVNYLIYAYLNASNISWQNGCISIQDISHGLQKRRHNNLVVHACTCTHILPAVQLSRPFGR